VSTLERIQKEHVEWSTRNFPGRPSWQPLLGICEELGELVGSINHEEQRDAIGDVVIFAIDYCNAMGWDVESVFDRRISHRPSASAMSNLLFHVGKLQHCYLKAMQRIRGNASEHEANGKHALGSLFAELEIVAGGTQAFLNCVDDTWETVKKRDWVKHRAEAAT